MVCKYCIAGILTPSILCKWRVGCGGWKDVLEYGERPVLVAALQVQVPEQRQRVDGARVVVAQGLARGDPSPTASTPRKRPKG